MIQHSLLLVRFTFEVIFTCFYAKLPRLLPAFGASSIPPTSTANNPMSSGQKIKLHQWNSNMSTWPDMLNASTIYASCVH